MRTPLVLFSSMVISVATACGTESHDAGPGDGSTKVAAGLAPHAQPPEPTPEPVTPEPATPEPATPEPTPELSERKQALANVGRAAFGAIKTGEFEALLRLTPVADDFLSSRCPGLTIAPREELAARFEHCHETISWATVAEAQVFAGKPTGRPAPGCEPGIEDYGRLQLFLHMNDEKIWRVDFNGAVGQDGNAIGISGEVSCREVDSAPKLD